MFTNEKQQYKGFKIKEGCSKIRANISCLNSQETHLTVNSFTNSPHLLPNTQKKYMDEEINPKILYHRQGAQKIMYKDPDTAHYWENEPKHI